MFLIFLNTLNKKGIIMNKNQIEFTDIVKINQSTLYITIPIEEARTINLKRKDAVKIKLTKLEPVEVKK